MMPLTMAGIGEKCKIQKQKDLKIELLHKHRFLSIIEDVQGGVRLNY